MMQHRPWEIRMPWQEFDPAGADDLSGSEGIYQLADADRNVIYTAYAGGREPFGFRGCLARHFSEAETNPVIRERAKYFRYEICFSYLGRWKEVLGRYFEEHGTLPEANLVSEHELPGLPRFIGGNAYRWGARWGDVPERLRTESVPGVE